MKQQQQIKTWEEWAHLSKLVCPRHSLPIYPSYEAALQSGHTYFWVYQPSTRESMSLWKAADIPPLQAPPTVYYTALPATCLSATRRLQGRLFCDVVGRLMLDYTREDKPMRECVNWVRDAGPIVAKSLLSEALLESELELLLNLLDTYNCIIEFTIFHRPFMQSRLVIWEMRSW